MAAVAGNDKAAVAAESVMPAPVPPAYAAIRAAAGLPRKKTKVVPVSVDYIRALENRRPRPSSFCRQLPAESPVEQDLMDSLLELETWGHALYDKDTAILEQYRRYGFANAMFEIDSADDEDDGLAQQGN